MSILPTTWTEPEIGEVAEVNPRKDVDLDGDELVTFVPMAAVDEISGSIASGMDRPYREVSKGFTQFRDGDVIFAKITPSMENGKSAVARDLTNGIGIGSTEFHVLRSNGAVEPEFLWRFVRQKTFREDAQAVMSGAVGQQRVPAGYLKAHRIPLPPLAEQQRIVAKLNRLTAGIRRASGELDRIPTLVSRYKQRLLALAFSGELTISWREVHGLSTPRPASLEEALAAPVRNGLSVRGSDHPPGIRALRLSALRGSEVDLSDVRYLPITAEKAERYEVREGDVLVSRGNGTRALVGIGSRVPKVAETTLFPDTAFRIRLAQERVNPKWFVSIWNSPQVRVQIESRAKTTAGIWKIAQSDLARIELLLPTLEEQDEIVRRIESAFRWLDRVSADRAAATRLLATLESAILAKAFRGELIPQDPADEPAGVLLERARTEWAKRAKSGAPTRVRSGPKNRENTNMARRLIEVLSEAADWLPAQEAFRRCGVADGAPTDQIEGVYAELRALDKEGRISVEPVVDPRGRKLHDRLKLRPA